jgi:hypothetical protein
MLDRDEDSTVEVNVEVLATRDFEHLMSALVDGAMPDEWEAYRV